MASGMGNLRMGTVYHNSMPARLKKKWMRATCWAGRGQQLGSGDGGHLGSLALATAKKDPCLKLVLLILLAAKMGPLRG